MNGKEGPRVLIVEDEKSLARSIQLELEHEHYQAEIALNGYEALGKVSDDKWDLIILDLMLPGIDGFQVCQRIREASDVPIIMLTALDGIPDKVKGLDIGADDYLTKPFGMEELLCMSWPKLSIKCWIGWNVVFMPNRSFPQLFPMTCALPWL